MRRLRLRLRLLRGSFNRVNTDALPYPPPAGSSPPPPRRPPPGPAAARATCLHPRPPWLSTRLASYLPLAFLPFPAAAAARGVRGVRAPRPATPPRSLWPLLFPGWPAGRSQTDTTCCYVYHVL
ncbi:hypothetical protein BDA96_09G039100 [Sorghum bicolor]|uniref:Uncharacterized protein n=1 Tax=Sorghum bicolor TaxID=4558 RepID=A0A921U3Q0_SORBI|nr:hypothetical protein BDA96_09G039100 [Sorghum bicolor]